MSKSISMFSYPRQDLVAGVVVFLVAVPLCLGIAVACGVPPISGLVAGICAGLIVPWISRSPLSVSGPAAGLTSVVLAEVAHLGGFPFFLSAVMAAGLIQFALGILRLGKFSALVPSAVIKGMLAAIGITIILKQIPVAFGVGALGDILAHWSVGPVIIGALSLGMLVGWTNTPLAKIHFIPPALVMVIVASLVAALFANTPWLALTPAQFVRVPLGSIMELREALPRPELSALRLSVTWSVGLTVAVVASIETLLSLQAVDRLDPLKRKSPPDRELLAQGIANMTSGFFGGLPVTAVIVRSGTNVAAGARQRLSALVHGLLLVITLVFFGTVINRIPLAALAALLIQVGFRLASPALVRTQYKLGLNQFLPFVLTIVAVIATDLMKGVIFGTVIGVVFVIRQNTKNAIQQITEPDGTIVVKFHRDGTFISKPELQSILNNVSDNQCVIVDGRGEFVDHDIKEVLQGFVQEAPSRNIGVQVRGIDLSTTMPSGGH